MFKKIILATIMVSAVVAGQVEWATNYKVAVEKAKKDNKPIFLMLSQPGCPACIQMKDGVFKKDELVINEINANFVAVDINILKDDWNKKFRAYATPTFYFLDKNENKLGRQFVGGADGAEFLKILKDTQKQR